MAGSRPISSVQPFTGSTGSAVSTGITPAGTYGYGVDRKWVVDANGNAVISSYRRLFNVLDYGAVADGITDDGPAINTAIAAAIAAGGGTVYFPPVVFITGGITVPGTGDDVSANFLYGGIERNALRLTIANATDANPAHKKLTLSTPSITAGSEVYDNTAMNTTVGAGTSNYVAQLVCGTGGMTAWPANGTYSFGGGTGGYLIQTALTATIAAASGISINFLGEYERSPIYVDLGNAVSSVTDALTVTIVSGFDGRIEIQNLLFMGVRQATDWNCRRLIYCSAAAQNEIYIRRCGAYQLAAYKSIFAVADGQTKIVDSEFKGVCTLNGAADNGTIVADGTHQLWVNGVMFHDYSNWKALTYNLGTSQAIVHYLAPAEDSLGFGENSLVSCENLYVDENGGPIQILNYANHRTTNVYVRSFKNNVSGAVGASSVYLYQVDHAHIADVWSGLHQNPFVTMWDAGAVTCERLTSNLSGGVNDTILVDDGAGWAGPFTKSLRVVECTYAGTTPGVNMPLTPQSVGGTGCLFSERLNGVEMEWRYAAGALTIDHLLKSGATLGQVTTLAAGDSPQLCIGKAYEAASGAGVWIRVVKMGQLVKCIQDGASALAINDPVIPSAGTAGQVTYGVTANGACIGTVFAAASSAVTSCLVFFQPMTQ